MLAARIAFSDAAASSGRSRSSWLAAAAYVAGHGLRGMRERATAAGGTIDTGPLPGGGFRVAARLPLSQAPATAEATEATATSPPGTANSSAPQEANR